MVVGVPFARRIHRIAHCNDVFVAIYWLVLGTIERNLLTVVIEIVASVTLSSIAAK